VTENLELRAEVEHMKDTTVPAECYVKLEDERDELKAELAEVWVSHTKLQAQLEAVREWRNRCFVGRTKVISVKELDDILAATEGGDDD
jgi:hypothetical protein